MSSRAVTTAMMRAVRVHKFGGPEVMGLDTKVPIPKPAENQVLVKVKSAGVNPVDTYIRDGKYAVLPNLPFVPGKDAAGIVEAVGSKVTRFKKGDRVYNLFADTGTYAEYTLSGQDSTFRLHDNLTFDQGAAIGTPYYTAYRAIVTKANATPGQKLLVHGASGAVGLAAVQIGRALGLTVYGTAGTPEGLKLVQQNGACAVFNHRESGYLQKIKEATGGKGVDVIVEMLSDVNLVKDFDVLAIGGTITIVGCRGSLDFSPRLTMGKEAAILGVGLAHATAADYARTSEFLWSGQTLGWMKPVVGLRYKLEQAKEAHEEVIAHRAGTKGKIVLTVS